MEVGLQKLVSQVAAAWPAIRDILVGPVLVAAIAVGSALLLNIALRIVAGIIKRSRVRKKVPHPDDYRERRNRIVHAVGVIARTALWTVAGVVVLTQVQRIMGYTENTSLVKFGAWLVGPGLRIAVTVVVAGLASWLVNYFSHKVVKIEAAEETAEETEKAQRRQTILHSLRVLMTVIIWVLAGLMVLTDLGVKVGAIIAGLGVVGIAVGFGAQSLIRDILGGIFIVLEDQMRLGDVVRVGGVTGTVEKMSLRVTVIRSVNGHYITVPNGEIKIVENMTHDWSRAVVKVGVGYGANIDEVIRALKSAVDDLKHDESVGRFIMDEPQIKAINEFGDSSMEVAVWIRTHPAQQWEVGRMARRYIKARFEEAGIEIPFPQITLTLGEQEAELLAGLGDKKENRVRRRR